MKPQTPYQRLLWATRLFRTRALYPNSHVLWTWSKDQADKDVLISLRDLTVRAQTANSLGHNMLLVYVDGGLRVEYEKRPDDIDWIM
jgi:hypothetical protein